MCYAYLAARCFVSATAKRKEYFYKAAYSIIQEQIYIY